MSRTEHPSNTHSCQGIEPFLWGRRRLGEGRCIEFYNIMFNLAWFGLSGWLRFLRHVEANNRWTTSMSTFVIDATGGEEHVGGCDPGAWRELVNLRSVMWCLINSIYLSMSFKIQSSKASSSTEVCTYSVETGSVLEGAWIPTEMFMSGPLKRPQFQCTIQFPSTPILRKWRWVRKCARGSPCCPWCHHVLFYPVPRKTAAGYCMPSVIILDCGSWLYSQHEIGHILFPYRRSQILK